MSQLKRIVSWLRVTLAFPSHVVFRYEYVCLSRAAPHLLLVTRAYPTQPLASAVHEESARIEAAFRKYCKLLPHFLLERFVSRVQYAPNAKLVSNIA